MKEAAAPESPPGGRRRQESGRRRQRILEAARRCFGARGFAGATVEAIAREAGVSNGLLYQFFRNKEHLFEVVVGDLIRDWMRAMVPEAGPEASAAGALEAMFRRSVEFCASHPLLPALMTRDQLLELERFSDVGSRRVATHRSYVAGILRRGIGTGELRDDLDVASMADVICQLQVDYSTRAYRRDPLHPLSPTLVDTAVDVMLRAVRAPRDADALHGPAPPGGAADDSGDAEPPAGPIGTPWGRWPARGSPRGEPRCLSGR